MVNDQGGINGRKINFITSDDGYRPPKTVEQARKLVESDEVLLIFNSLGTPTNTAIQKYMNKKKVPQLFVATGASKWGEPEGLSVDHGLAARLPDRGADLRQAHPEGQADAKIGVLKQNDDYGKDYLKGLKDGLGAKAASMIVAEVSYETTEPTVDSQIVQLKDTGANVFFNIATPKFAAQAIRKVADLGWKPVQYLNNVSASVGGVMKPAGFENAQGIITAAYLKDPTDQQWDNDEDMKAWKAFMDKYYPEANRRCFGIYGYTVAQTMMHVLKHCGDDLTRANIMKQAASIKELELDACCRASRSTPVADRLCSDLSRCS